tara:strand:- start:1450 stop:1674 length:225 start_codon:yes stop_codon:yes gene_type:complete
MKIGDLVELSSYGKNIQENQPYISKAGVIMRISEHAEDAKFTHAVSWFGVKNRNSIHQVLHPRRDLKHLTNEKS